MRARLYWEVARRGFRRFATYRSAAVAGVFTNSMFGFMRAYILLAVIDVNGDAAGLDRGSTLTYVWMTQAMIAPIGLWGWSEVSDRIRSGEIATDLSRPFDLVTWYLAQDLGRAMFHLLARGIPPLLIGGLVFGIDLPRAPALWVAGAVSIVLAVVISFGIRFLSNTAAFWILDTRGVGLVYALATSFFSGFVIPINFFPPWLETFARATPFPAMVQVPIEVLVGATPPGGTARALALQLAWAATLLVACRVAVAAGTRKLVVQGG